MRRGRIKSKMREIQTEVESSSPALYQELLPREVIEEAVTALQFKFRRRVYTPFATLWIWVGQVFDSDGSCRGAVAKAFSWLFADEKERCSTDCSPYCRARGRLGEDVVERVTQKVSEELDHESMVKKFNRNVYMFDGTTCTSADTAENQKVFPQHGHQKKGCGFPIIRVVGMFSMVTGAIRDLAIGEYLQSEIELFRSLWGRLKAGDIAVADGYFASYLNLSLLSQKGVDCVFRLGENRWKFDFRKAKKKLGTRDALFEINRLPVAKRPKWMTKEEYLNSVPETFTVRVLDYTVKARGYRTKKVRLVTTLTDEQEYSSAELAKLYAERWKVEIELRDIKTTLQMDFLDVRSPQMIRKEIWMHMLAYNLIRKVMWDTAVKYEMSIEDVSFKGTLQLVLAVAQVMGSKPETATDENYEALLKGVYQRRLRRRPRRSEPRVVKKRPKHYPKMQKPRPKPKDF